MTPESRKEGNCPECGTYVFEIRDYDKMVKEQERLEKSYRGFRAYHGEQEAKWVIQDIKNEEGMKYLQRKVRRQAEAIQRLEAKLRRLGEQPYKEEDKWTNHRDPGC